MDETLDQRAQRIFGKPAEEVILQMLHDGASIHEVALRLEAFPNAIRYWLKVNGYRVQAKRVNVLEKVGADHA